VPLSARPAARRLRAHIAEICHKKEFSSIADEVMTGMGRTGKPFFCAALETSTDMILVGKGVASG